MALEVGVAECQWLVHFCEKGTLTFDEKTLAESRHEDELANCVHYACWIGATSGYEVGTFGSVNISGGLWLYICELGVRHTKLLFSQTLLGLCEQNHVQGLRPCVCLHWCEVGLQEQWTQRCVPGLPLAKLCCAAPPVGPRSAPRPDWIYIFTLASPGPTPGSSVQLDVPRTPQRLGRHPKGILISYPDHLSWLPSVPESPGSMLALWLKIHRWVRGEREWNKDQIKSKMQTKHNMAVGTSTLYWAFPYTACAVESLKSVCCPGNTAGFIDKVLAECKCNKDDSQCLRSQHKWNAGKHMCYTMWVDRQTGQPDRRSE